LERRQFLGTIATAAGVARVGLDVPAAAGITEVRNAFPALSQRINGHPLVYLDSAATTLRPNPVIDAVAQYYRTENANPSGTLHTLARRSAAAQDEARRAVASFIGARDPLEVVFTRGTTEGINLVASTWGAVNVRPNDEILIGISEHTSNLLPWRALARRNAARLVTFPVDADGRVNPDEVASRVTERTRIVAFSHVSNVLGMVNPAARLCDAARGPGRIVVLDAAQSAPHLPLDVQTLGCDFMAFSSHKMLGPMGVGVLWGRRTLLDAMPPYQFGSNMAHEVDFDGEHVSEGALKFGAGSPNVSGPVGLAAAIRFLQSIRTDTLAAYERSITEQMMDGLRRIPRLQVLGDADPAARVGVFAFSVEGVPPGRLAAGLDGAGVAIRAGDLAALPLLRHFGMAAAARASCYVYTSSDDVDRFLAALVRTIRSG